MAFAGNGNGLWAHDALSHDSSSKPGVAVTRWLARFGSGLQEQLNVVAGVVGLAALALAGAGLLADGTVRTVLVAVGLAIGVPMIVVGIIRAWPPKALTPADAVGEDRPLADLQSIYPRIPALGILGTRAAGKTTLKSRLLQLPAPKNPYSQNVTFHVSPLLHRHRTYIALLDGRGESYDQQFEIAAKADIVIVLLDHNDIDTTEPNTDRLDRHHEFGVQVRDYLAGREVRPKAVHLLMNKADLWRNAEQSDQEAIRAFFSGEVEDWRSAYSSAVTAAEHSNNFPDDTTDLIESIEAHWAEIKD